MNLTTDFQRQASKQINIRALKLTTVTAGEDNS